MPPLWYFWYYSAAAIAAIILLKEERAKLTALQALQRGDMEIIKVVLVDDHQVVREGLRRMLALEDDIKVVAEASGGEEALSLIEALSPDIVMLDIKMPGMDGIEVTRRLAEKKSSCRVVMLTLYDEYLPQAVEAGAAGYLVKEIKHPELVDAIRRVFRGELIIGESLAARPQAAEHVVRKLQGMCQAQQIAGAPGPRLSPRELVVLSYVAKGYANKQIGQALHISEQTIKNHVTSILRKLDANDRTHAVVIALNHGWVAA